jgi:hypothetical protein
MELEDEERMSEEKFKPYFDHKISKIKSVILDKNRSFYMSQVDKFE